ncbi:hypothetical protein ACSFA8_25690 [Variovorax sp. RT4R15]|uniref:hypothetical protein n=1 Tax=Variovorax sp. RT4R15 TaxID=3443737 RepID=UPI003F44731C
MESPDLELIKKALSLIEEAINGRLHAASAVPYFAPTDIGGLPPAVQEAEMRNEEQINYGNRVRAGVHLSLASASAALNGCALLMEDYSQKKHTERQADMERGGANAQSARDLAARASAVLFGRESPKLDTGTEIKKLTGAFYQRFSHLRGPR